MRLVRAYTYGVARYPHKGRTTGMLEDDITEAKRMGLRDEKIKKLSAALQAMVNRWEPDCDGQDRVMWENACEALEFART
jgi:hypothetical protein